MRSVTVVWGRGGTGRRRGLKIPRILPDPCRFEACRPYRLTVQDGGDQPGQRHGQGRARGCEAPDGGTPAVAMPYPELPLRASLPAWITGPVRHM